MNALLLAGVLAGSVLPDEFPRFEVPGFEREMEALDHLHRLHYPGAGPKSTLWDEWLPGPALWPASEMSGEMRRTWARALAGRRIDAEGYVETHQHASIAHQGGWPFPFWAQGGGAGVWGWHFAIPGLPPQWHATHARTQEGWILAGAADEGIAQDCWKLSLTGARASAQAPPLRIEVLQSPFLQLRWRASGLDGAQPYIEWSEKEDGPFDGRDRMVFDPVEGAGVNFTMIPVYRSPRWRGTIRRLRIAFGNPAPGARVGIQALFTQYDTRHNVNNAAFLLGCTTYLSWTGDLAFLRGNLQRMRLALRYAMSELGGLEERCIAAPWVGHDGRSGLVFDAEGRKHVRPGHGIGNNYWDLLPMGYRDAYATMRYLAALERMAALEELVASRPGWNLPAGPLRLDPAALRAHANAVRERAAELFWVEETGRFASGIDLDGVRPDYGFTFLNLEAIHYGLATPAQARSILDWLSGRREVAGDTARGKDIYHWRFGPRATTRRNVESYGWFWNGPETIPWGGQVQDGGAVLGFSYHDLMARLRVLGPDDCWRRLQEVIAWYEEVRAAGGYRAYYAVPGRGTLQGGGTPGGLGMDHEFFESVLLPQIMIDGFLGLRPRLDGLELDPRLPSAWPALRIGRIAFHGCVLAVRASRESIELECEELPPEGLRVFADPERWVPVDPGSASTGGTPWVWKAGESFALRRVE